MPTFRWISFQLANQNAGTVRDSALGGDVKLHVRKGERQLGNGLFLQFDLLSESCQKLIKNFVEWQRLGDIAPESPEVTQLKFQDKLMETSHMLLFHIILLKYLFFPSLL